MNSGGNGTTVTALPNLGYRFVNWSDGFTKAARADIGADANLNVTANFARNARRSTTILLKVSANSIVRGWYVTLTSGLSGGVAAGSSVRLEVYSPGMRMNTLERLGTRAVDLTGWSSFRFMATLHGTYQFRVRFPGDSSSKAPASPVRNNFVK